MIFIRPWFLIFLAVPLLLWLFKGKLAPTAVLSKYVDERLLPFVTVRFAGDAQNKRPWLFVAVWTVLVLAGAGPAYEKISVPSKISAPAHVIVMDMSPVMTGETLEAAKRKLYDLLGALKGHQAGLVVYDEKGYVVSPLTQDLNIIRTMIPGLGENVMPAYGNRADLGFEKADELFKNVGIKNGQIIFLTAGGYDSGKLAAAARKLPYDIGIIGFGSGEEKPISLPNGGFLRASDGTVAFSGLNENTLKKIGTYVKADVTGDDIRTVLSAFSDRNVQSGKADSLNADVWRDLGPFLLILTAPFFAFLFRRGVIYVFIFALASNMFGYAPQAMASEWFLRPDQQEHKLLEQGVDAYRKGDYETAKGAFESLHKTPGYAADALYNKGNALAHLNDIQGAIAAYDKALQINPNHAAAQFNKEYLQKQLPPQQQDQENRSESGDSQNQDKQNQNGDSNNSNESETDNQGQPSDAGQNSENEADGNRNETQSGTQNNVRQNNSDSNKQNPQAAANLSDAVENNRNDNVSNNTDEDSKASTPQNMSDVQHDADQNQSPSSLSPHEIQQSSDTFSADPLDQESAQLLNRIRQDPSRLLRYRLYQQRRQQNE